MSLRKEQCNKVCTILDNVLANRPTERDSLIVAVRKAFAEPKKGEWIKSGRWGRVYKCNQCGNFLDFDGVNTGRGDANFCPSCGTKMEVRCGIDKQTGID